MGQFSEDLIKRSPVSGRGINEAGEVQNIVDLISGIATQVASGIILSEGAGTGNFITLQKAVTTAGTPVQLAADTALATGTKVLLRASPDNTNNITIGYSSATALHTNSSFFRLLPGGTLTIRVSNLNKIWIDSYVDGEGVDILYET